MNRPSRLALGVALAAAIGCGSDADSPPAASIELGTGTEAFEPIQAGQHLTLYAGNQGGYHVWLSYRVTGLEPGGVKMALDVVPGPPARPAHSEVELDLRAVDDDDDAQTYQYLGWTAQVLDPECVAPGPVQLDLTLTDVHARSVHAAIEVVAEPPEGGFSRGCRR